MNPNQALTLQRERAKIESRLETTYGGSLTPQADRSKDVKRLKEIKRLLNDYYLKK